MKAYRVRDIRDYRDAKAELKLYTFEQLKESFRPDKELAKEEPEQAAKFEKVADISDLEDWLQADYGFGEVQPWEFEEVEVESLEEIKRENDILDYIDSHGFIDKQGLEEYEIHEICR